MAHDALLVPAVLLAGVAASRAGQWPKAALIVAALVTLATLPTVLALGRRADNPSILPLDYGRGLLLVLTAIGLVALVPKLKSRSVALGLSAGLAAGLLVAGLMAANDMIDPAQSALFLGHAALLGAVLGGVFGTRLYGQANAFACGLLAGLLAWVGWQLTLLPILLGGHPQWSAALLAADSPPWSGSWPSVPCSASATSAWKSGSARGGSPVARPPQNARSRCGSRRSAPPRPSGRSSCFSRPSSRRWWWFEVWPPAAGFRCAASP